MRQSHRTWNGQWHDPTILEHLSTQGIEKRLALERNHSLLDLNLLQKYWSVQMYPRIALSGTPNSHATPAHHHTEGWELLNNCVCCHLYQESFADIVFCWRQLPLSLPSWDWSTSLHAYKHSENDNVKQIVSRISKGASNIRVFWCSRFVWKLDQDVISLDIRKQSTHSLCIWALMQRLPSASFITNQEKAHELIYADSRPSQMLMTLDRTA